MIFVTLGEVTLGEVILRVMFVVVTALVDVPVVSAVVFGGSCVGATYGSIFVVRFTYFTVGFKTSGNKYVRVDFDKALRPVKN